MFSTVGDINGTVARYVEYHGGCSVPWEDVMIHVGGYLEYCGGIQYHGGTHSTKMISPRY